MKKQDKKSLLFLLLIPLGWIAYAGYKRNKKRMEDKLKAVSQPDTKTPPKKISVISIPSIETKFEGKKAIVINVGSKGLNVRQSMSTTADILGTLKNGSVISYKPTGNKDWVFMHYSTSPDKVLLGFVSTKYVKLTQEPLVVA